MTRLDPRATNDGGGKAAFGNIQDLATPARSWRRKRQVRVFDLSDP